jgi:hypothetical protein
MNPAQDCRTDPQAHVGRCDNPMPELTLSPQSGTMNLATVQGDIAIPPRFKGVVDGDKAKMLTFFLGRITIQ